MNANITTHSLYFEFLLCVQCVEEYLYKVCLMHLIFRNVIENDVCEANFRELFSTHAQQSHVTMMSRSQYYTEIRSEKDATPLMIIIQCSLLHVH